MLWVSDHVHVQNAGFVEPLNDVLRRHPNSGDKELCAAVDDDADQVIELAFRVVVASSCMSQRNVVGQTILT